MVEEVLCCRCARSMEPGGFDKCPSCYRLVCNECRHSTGGRYFCSSQCAHYYYFEDEEEA